MPVSRDLFIVSSAVTADVVAAERRTLSCETARENLMFVSNGTVLFASLNSEYLECEEDRGRASKRGGQLERGRN